MTLACVAVALHGVLLALKGASTLADQDAERQLAPSVQNAARQVAPSVIASWLAALHNDSADERARAQRALEAELGWRDFDLLHGAALAGDAEVRRRLVEVLAADEVRLELAVRLAVDDAPPLAELGRSAISELISRWSPGKKTRGLSDKETLTELENKFERVLVLDPAQSSTLRGAIDEMARFADGAPPLVVDPAWIERANARASSVVLDGNLERLLMVATRRSGAGWESFGIARDEESKAPPWIFITEPAGLGRKAGQERWIDWCIGVVRPGGGPSSAACARALACTGWPAALSWLEARWLELKDANALDGMIAAADRGRPSGALALAATQRELFSRMQREVERRTPAADARASEMARALANAFAVGAGDESSAAPALERLGTAGEGNASAQRWLALVALEGRVDASASVRERVGSLIAEDDHDAARDEHGETRDQHEAIGPATRFQALRTLAAFSSSERDSRALTIGGPAALFTWAESKGYGEILLELFAQLGALPPASWSDPSSLPEAWAMNLRARVFEWWLQAADEAAAERHLSAWLVRDASDGAHAVELEELAERLGERMRKGERKRIERVLELAHARRSLDPDAGKLEDLELLAGSASALASDAIAARRLAATPTSRRELLCVAALAASAHGAEARGAVIAGLGGTLALEDRVAALDRALSELRRARAVALERTFVTDVRTAIRNADRTVQTRLRVDQWPPPGKRAPVDVRLLDRALDRADL